MISVSMSFQNPLQLQLLLIDKINQSLRTLAIRAARFVVKIKHRINHRRLLGCRAIQHIAEGFAVVVEKGFDSGVTHIGLLKTAAGQAITWLLQAKLK